MKKGFWTTLSWPLLAKLGVLFALFLACCIGFVAIADEVREGETIWADEAVLTAINTQANAFWDNFFYIITQFGGVVGVVAITAGIAAILLLRKKYKKTILLLAGVGGAALINATVKLIFERARPDLWEQLVVETSFSFPSGHAMVSSALAFSLIAVLWGTKYRIAAICLGALYVIIIGLSRLYLGVHYPTDIIAGWCMSGLWVILVVSVLNGKSTLKRLLQT